MDSTQIYQKIQERYSSAAKGPVGVKEQQIVESFGYSADELRSIPDGATLGLACGNAIAIANLDRVRRPSAFAMRPTLTSLLVVDLVVVRASMSSWLLRMLENMVLSLASITTR